MPAKKSATKKSAGKKAAANTAARSATRAKAAARKAAANGAVPRDAKVRVRMYRQGLGDCFLLTFFTGPQPVHILIDCGSIGEQTTDVTLKDVGEDIVRETDGHLTVLIATHEHQDHVNGFLKNQALFDAAGFDVDRVWLAWTEDGTDSLAQDLEKYRGDLLTAVTLASNALASQGLAADDLNTRVRGLLEFVGDLPAGNAVLGAKDLAKSVDEAMTWVTTRANNKDRFLKPGMVIEPAWLPGIRVYVLGPPRSTSQISTLGKHGDENLYELTMQTGADIAECSAFAMSAASFAAYRDALEGDARAVFERRLPFDPRFRVEITNDDAFRATYAAYYDRAEAWRRIDTDWLSGGGTLALQLDNATNNTSLVLAFELIEDGRVLLFPGDAQLGNWLSWDRHTFKVKGVGGTRKVKAAELLAQTVFYKVGHHSSHNATVKARGLERMRRDDLVAMIPLDSITAENKWKETSWPAEKLYTALCERTRGRVLRSDTGWPDASDRPATVPSGTWDTARKAAEDDRVIVIGDRYIDYHLV